MKPIAIKVGESIVLFEPSLNNMPAIWLNREQAEQLFGELPALIEQMPKPPDPEDERQLDLLPAGACPDGHPE